MPAADTAASSWWRRHRAALLAWSVVAAVLFVTQLVARGADAARWGAAAVAGWVQFDGPEYLEIATRGYQARQLVWFPLYPLLFGGLDRVLPGGPVVPAVLVSACAGLAASVLFWRWAAVVPAAVLRSDEVATGTGTPLRRALSGTVSPRAAALAVLLLYPYGWFLYGVVYADALFLAMAVAAFVAVERDRLVLAGVFGALATAARPSGFTVVAGLVVLTLERAEVLTVRSGAPTWSNRLALPTALHPGRLRARHAAPLLSVLGLAAYTGYQWVAWDNPLRFVTEQANYHSPGPDTLLKRQYFDAWYQPDLFDARHLATTTAQAVILVAVLLAVPAVGRRLGWGYGAYVLGLAAFPAVSVSTFMGVGRYLLPAFPCWALVGAWLATRPRLRVLWCVVSGTTMLVMAFGFARSWYLT